MAVGPQGRKQDREQDQPLSGGMMNTVLRRGARVVRTAPPHAPALQEYLTALTASGFEGAPRPLALYEDGTEELTFVEGDVAVPPFPIWATEDWVVSASARLLRRYHDAAQHVPFDPGAAWPTALSDPEGGTLLCHNDPCLENLVFRDGAGHALIDFDLAAPGRPVWDLAALAFYMGPTLPPEVLTESKFARADVLHRLSLLAEGYGMSAEDRRALPETIEQYNEVSRTFVKSMLDQGNPLFVDIVEQAGGWPAWERVKDRRSAWLRDQRPAFLKALAA
ncbi:aminoglycoside phosphotransferase family protein [Nocardiopsis valliformis]|uniref:aminoglycoside phosphotransferase family protein n=1 Tax=Nocardiopsis valliformis TaxID=239974 RepID=UPI00034A84BE|nr:aminoglycoside phosphotransferase family protein [Nocardiopsis valliformis]